MDGHRTCKAKSVQRNEQRMQQRQTAREATARKNLKRRERSAKERSADAEDATNVSAGSRDRRSGDDVATAVVHPLPDAGGGGLLDVLALACFSSHGGG